MTLNDLQAYMRTYLAEHGGDDHLLRSLLLSDFVQFIRRRQHAETRNAGSQDHAALPRVDTRGARRIVFGLLQNEQPKKARTAKKPSSKKATAATAEVADSNDNS
jgi:hypothetical protein